MKSDLYSKVTSRVLTDQEKGARPWLNPWNAEHIAGRVSRPLRWNGQPYSSVNVLILWVEAVAKGYAAPLLMATVFLLRPHSRNVEFRRLGEQRRPVRGIPCRGCAKPPSAKADFCVELQAKHTSLTS